MKLLNNKARAVVINAKERVVIEKEIDIGLGEIQKIVEGPICYAHQFENGDVLYVNDEGLLNGDINYYFSIEGAYQPFAGNGVIVGEEEENYGSGDGSYVIHDAKTKNIPVKFMDKEDLLAALQQKEFEL